MSFYPQVPRDKPPPPPVGERIHIIEGTHSPALLIHSLLKSILHLRSLAQQRNARPRGSGRERGHVAASDHSDGGGKRNSRISIAGRSRSRGQSCLTQSAALSNLDKDNTLKEERHKSQGWLVEGGNATRDVSLLPGAPARDEACCQ